MFYFFQKVKKGCDTISSLKNETTETKSLLFNSSLISQYNDVESRVLYDVKIIRCGDYVQVYKFDNTRSKINEKDRNSKINIKKIDTDNLYKIDRVGELKSILLSNAIRSNLNCQRIAKANKDYWETFITLTFSENITDIAKANSIFNAWRTNIKKLKPDFKYIAVPEFQKRGAVHYHVLSNLSKEDKEIIFKQLIKTGKAVKYDDLYDVKYWTKGFARVDFIKNDYKKIYGYICKYMTKDIDNKLFGKHRYFNSQNLIKPKEEYLNLSDPLHLAQFLELTRDKGVEYQSNYKDIYTDSDILFMELL